VADDDPALVVECKCLPQLVDTAWLRELLAAGEHWVTLPPHSRDRAAVAAMEAFRGSLTDGRPDVGTHEPLFPSFGNGDALES
jgi:hypothetical protein